MPGNLSQNGQRCPQMSAPTEYAEVQKGSLVVNGLMVSSALTIVATVIWPHLILSLFLIAQLGAAVCFCTLFIRIKGGYLRWQFGPGWIRGKVALSEIESTRIVMTKFAYGWSYRRDQAGSIFNRNGVLAVEIFYRGGKTLRLRTTRAHELQDLIDRAPERRQLGLSC